MASLEGDVPVIAQIPFDRVEDLAPYLARQGADALTLTAPPRAVLPVFNDEDDVGVARFSRGRLYGRALFPLLLNTLSRWASKLPVPVIACGGISSAADALTCLTLGAAAVQVDALLWRDPALLNHIAQALAGLLGDRHGLPSSDDDRDGTSMTWIRVWRLAINLSFWSP